MDKGNEGKTSFTPTTMVNGSTSPRYTTTPEARTDDQNEALADWLKEKLGASETRPYLAVAYSNIPKTVIERHLATAREVGKNPPALFMHLIKREPLWRAYKQRKAAESNDA